MLFPATCTMLMELVVLSKICVKWYFVYSSFTMYVHTFITFIFHKIPLRVFQENQSTTLKTTFQTNPTKLQKDAQKLKLKFVHVLLD